MSENETKDTFVRALKDAGDNVTLAAERLGIARRTLQKRMREYGIPEGKSGRRKMTISYRGKRRLYAVGVGAALGAVAVYAATRGQKA